MDGHPNGERPLSGVADRRPVAQNITSRFLRPRTFSAGVMRPVSLKVGTGDFAFSTDHRRIAIGFVVGTLRSKPTPAAAAAFRRPKRAASAELAAARS
jgi:hypothetical protein